MARKGEGRIRAGGLFLVLGALLFGAAHAAAGTRVFTDALGRAVTIAYPPERIVSLAPAITETLFALGLKDEIAGVTRFSNFPPAAVEKPRVGSYVNLNIEAIVSLKPDLILATAAGNPQIQARKLQDMGFPVYVVYPKDTDGVLATIRRIAEIVGRSERGGAIVRDMRERIERISHRVRGLNRPRVFFQIGRDPIFTVSRGSFADNLISLAGGDNIAKDARIPYPSYNLEEVILKAPEVIIVSSMYVDTDHSGWLEEWKRWDVLPAVKDNRLYTIDSDLVDRPSVRIVVGLEKMARMIHPEAFPPEPSDQNKTSRQYPGFTATGEPPLRPDEGKILGRE
ncbi:MAG: cobalamin-binding protein [Deltaproteobacteria bacterium]|nr:cobalamin-binding protein [Deltaproteobacteria bacterium]MBW2120484.1 cobalamin-binding protein [Deltaproteobacteria bacterium]